MNDPTLEKSTLGTAYAGVLAQRRQSVSVQLERILHANPRFLWEVGSGHGHFLTAYATAHPEKTCIGVDLVGERIERATRKRDRAALPNLHFIRAEARLFLEALPAAAKISDLFILFPDPWPKLRHHKHRVLQAKFLASVARHALPECRLYFRTDYRPYFDDACAVIAESTLWRRLDAPWPFEFETVFQKRAQHYDSLVAGLRPAAS